MNCRVIDESKLFSNSDPYLSLCTTCMGRIDHLRRTMPENIAAAEGQAVEFVLLNYSSPDSCDEWVHQTLKHEMALGIVAYYRYDGATQFHHAHAKNLAHRLARGSIICNVDADNYIGQGFAEYLLNAFSIYPNSFFRAVPFLEGIFGRLAFLKSDFYRLGGYDETLKHGWGWEDEDLILRAKALGLNEMFIEDLAFLRFISHDDGERVKYTSCKIKEDSSEKHREMSMESRARGDLIANKGLHWGSGKIIKNFEDWRSAGLVDPPRPHPESQLTELPFGSSQMAEAPRVSASNPLPQARAS